VAEIFDLLGRCSLPFFLLSPSPLDEDSTTLPAPLTPPSAHPPISPPSTHQPLPLTALPPLLPLSVVPSLQAAARARLGLTVPGVG
jgi:hypothetical protein